MLGYLDTNATDPGYVIVNGLDPEFSDNGFDVYVYAVGGVVLRGGDYTIGDTTIEHTVVEPFDGTFIEGEEGNYMVFRDLTGNGFELEFQPQNRGNGTFRAVVNAVEVVAKSVGVPGDFNGDGQLTAADIDDLTTQSAGGTNPAAYDLNVDALVNDGDVNVWIKDLFNSWIGDADLNGEFNSSDLIQVLASGTYETDTPSAWTSGDFNGDARTNSTDLVAALADGGYENGPRAAVASVPEPTGALLVLIGLLGVGAIRRR
jgi:MYXO-CTERM domain-containing protein